ncbi:LemA family protein [candidate division KSB1 bacterium]
MSPYQKTKIKSSWIIIGIIAIIVIYAVSTYNGMVSSNENVEEQWGNVESAYQARLDKTNNLLEIVKGAANFERETLNEVIEKRTRATSVNIEANDLTQENLNKFQQAQDAFGSSLSRLLVVVEKYPELKAVQAFRDFQAQYEGMENRINVERRKFNQSAKKLNRKIKRFPNNVLNNFYGFEEKPYFESVEGAEKAPQISF